MTIIANPIPQQSNTYDRYNGTQTDELNYQDLKIMRTLGRNLGNKVTYTELIDNREVSKSFPLTTTMLKTLEVKLVKARLFQQDNSFPTVALLTKIVILDDELEEISIEI